jgi:predicted PurR-regulated permease PerM
MQFTPTQKAATAWSLIAALVAFVVWLLAPVLTPFVVAAVLAYALTPLVNRLDRLGQGRIPRLLAVRGGRAAAAGRPAGCGAADRADPGQGNAAAARQVPVLFDRLNAMLQPLLAQWGLQLSLDVENIKAFVLKYLNANFEDAFTSLMASVKIGGSVALAIVGNAVLIPVALFYLLMDWDRFVAQLLQAGAAAGAQRLRQLYQ